MRCREKFAGERCRFHLDHGPVHASRDNRLVWGREMEYDGFIVDADATESEEEDEDDLVTLIDSAQQFDEPFAHVLVEKRIVRRSCLHCRGTGVAYCPLTGEGPKCPHCQRRELRS